MIIGAPDHPVLNVYNWGEYISDGAEDSFDTIREFEKWYENVAGKSAAEAAESNE